MKVRTILLSAIMLMALGGCHHINHASFKTKSVSISAGTKSSGGGARHCPPGQAKKGNC
ncbi:MAG: hypothetical protein K0S46_2504 [Moraxellaceae bacterium]|jgi:hypothetical protein|nr:hypothetical protein [Moraxellaceae bacterium]